MIQPHPDINGISVLQENIDRTFMINSIDQSVPIFIQKSIKPGCTSSFMKFKLNSPFC